VGHVKGSQARPSLVLRREGPGVHQMQRVAAE
jgi:hypothetical protein